MKLLIRRLLVTVAFGLGAVAVPTVFIIFEAANTPRAELRDPEHVRALLHETRLAWEDPRTMAGTSTPPKLGLPEPGSGN